ncbi:beta-lactamase/transpeptidase-like protein [Cryphonectria parasitica EP155]|uniref:Beta-lactamase/transpeptidase-like protein n=1 Tax=Cryphonectria parasitica (strain ATCC 38755 / EP155) TaxID=660469 RepID=A0A9P4XUJ6_CRYP1|nr:beta-lactamase/transpeptidase-like protein [Cryphonectria parasitica EP155]KAF3761153.1 beta-lactamase/transpeptidase-like protein [Cryphonectria parasitica EP155]
MEKLNEILAAYVAKGDSTKGKVLGAAFTVVNRDGVLFEGSAGRVDIPRDSSPWGSDTLSWFASMTKLASAICILQTVERGLVTLDEDVRPRLPFLQEVQILRGFDKAGNPNLEANPSPITLRHLLTHTTGLGYDLSEEPLMRWRRKVGKDKINMTMTMEGYSTPLLFQPGTDWMYGTSVDWAMFVLERVTGQKVSEYMAQNILVPLGMNETGFWPKTLGKEPVGIPYRGSGGVLAGAPFPVPEEHPVESGGAGLYSTARDYAKLLRAVLQGKLLSQESMDLLFQPQLDEELQMRLIDRVGPAQFLYCPEYPPGMPMNFTFGGLTNLEDIPGKRSKGSIMWSGYVNPRWWIDRTNGVAAVLQVSLLPFADPIVARLYDELERAVYEGLVAK